MLRTDDSAAVLRPYEQSLPLALLRAREAVMARLRPVLRMHDLTEQQWRVLRVLSELDEAGIEVTALAERVFLIPSSLSRILRDLGERGLIERRSVSTDLRRAVVSITPSGLAMIAALGPDAAAANLEIEQIVGRGVIDDLKQQLNRLERALRSEGGEAEASGGGV